MSIENITKFRFYKLKIEKARLKGLKAIRHLPLKKEHKLLKIPFKIV